MAVTIRALVGSRLIVWGASLLALAAFGRKASVFSAMDPRHLTSPFSSAALNFAFAPAARWDSVWYLGIAHGGYFSRPSSAFFPLYPMLIRLGTIPFGSAPLIIGTLISAVATAIGLYLLYLLSRLDLGEAQARSTVMLVAFFPAALFLSAVYTEALFLMLTVGSIYAARRDRWAWAGVLGGLAGATRSGGVLILLPLAMLYLYGPREGRGLEGAMSRWRPRYAVARSAGWLTLVPAGLLAYIGYLAVAHHAPMAPFQAQVNWARQFAGPFGGVAKALAAAPGNLRLGVTGSTFVGGALDPISWPTHNLIDLLFLAFAAAGLAFSWRRLPFAYFVYTLALLAQACSYPTPFEPLMSISRFVLVMFPVFMGWGARLGERPRLGRQVLLGSAVLLGAFSAVWATWAWVA
jgi:hypothetical protein